MNATGVIAFIVLSLLVGFVAGLLAGRKNPQVADIAQKAVDEVKK